MEHTEGRGREAQVWVEGELLTVCDGISTPHQRQSPGVLERVRLSYASDEGIDWPQAMRGNTARRKLLDPLRRWSYVGYGQVAGIMPVRIDFGLVTMEDAAWSTDESLVGKYVRIAIDRLEVVPAEPDQNRDPLAPRVVPRQGEGFDE